MVQIKTIENDMEWLRKKSKKVNLEKENLKEDIKVLEEYCTDNEVLAMAAIQLGIDKRIIYLKNTDLDNIYDIKRNEKTILINPVIIKQEGLTKYWEVCVSCLDNMGLVLRPYKILVKYQDIKGKKHQKTFKGFPTTVFSHEYDHLDGILHIDKALQLKVMPSEERKIFRETHGYDIISKTGDFVYLLNNYKEEYND